MLVVIAVVALLFKGIKYILASVAIGVFIVFLISSMARDRPVIWKTVGGGCEYASAREGVGFYRLNLPVGECRRVKMRMDFVLTMLLDYPGMKVADRVGAKYEKVELYMYFIRPELRLNAIALPRPARNGLALSAGFYGEAASIESLEGEDKSLLSVVYFGDLIKVYRVYGEFQVVYVFHKKQGSVELVDSRVLVFLDSAVIK